jgi:hypothetical protein
MDDIRFGLQQDLRKICHVDQSLSLHDEELLHPCAEGVAQGIEHSAAPQVGRKMRRPVFRSDRASSVPSIDDTDKASVAQSLRSSRYSAHHAAKVPVN